ncbi:hypothetical protein OIE49_36815 [Streptomyces sp. NBC_01788]|uniref:hypothetical protein n=1 Tax=Streptomyces sp. NBC_01788 TaxID=2975940 RepID=UPI002DDBB523|nr:hypothetical protein [Streptomyces sp. NBC_01788]WSB24496.1 hypothetical protein OIE49_00200 [Streptomyces sp. NBC_01788]WSB30952.1 hypothetical protein OIE49_36815 [Streptomyces sp. NBC_01788]
MRLGGAAVRRIWTVELHPRAGGPNLVCAQCTARTPACEATTARSAALAHLACHARADALPGHLRTCQCRAQGCRWHPRHRGCAGPVLLALTQGRGGRAWRLADACAACAAATSHTAVVPDTQLGSPHSPAPSVPARGPHRLGAEEHLRARETLTYLAAALPQFTSPAARLLAVQCTLRADARGHTRLPAGLLRGMRLRGRREVWEELAHAAWLRCPDLRPTQVEVQLLDATVLDQVPGRRSRGRAAHWALLPTPLRLPMASPPALRLIALILSAHSADRTVCSIGMDVLTRLGGYSWEQTAELLDRLVALRALTAWCPNRETDEVLWQSRSPHTEPGPLTWHPRLPHR